MNFLERKFIIRMNYEFIRNNYEYIEIGNYEFIRKKIHY